MKTTILLIFIAICAHAVNGSEIITLEGTNSYTVGPDDIAEIISVSEKDPVGGYRFSVNSNTYSAVFVSSGGIVSTLPFIVGRPNKTIKAFQSASGIGTSRVPPETDLLSTGIQPALISSPVVIPADSAGQVNILLESSTDLITWVGDTPGTYGSSTARRFFRVRGVAQ